MHVNLIDPDTGIVKSCKVGFSWTYLFFPVFTPLFRSDWITEIIAILLEVCSFGILNIIYAFFYNKNYIRSLAREGFLPTSENDKSILVMRGYLGPQIPVYDNDDF